jgi:hypothetical protein
MAQKWPGVSCGRNPVVSFAATASAEAACRSWDARTLKTRMRLRNDNQLPSMGSSAIPGGNLKKDYSERYRKSG